MIDGLTIYSGGKEAGLGWTAEILYRKSAATQTSQAVKLKKSPSL